MRKVLGIDQKNTGRKIAVYRNSDWNEWVVKFYLDGKYQVDADYFTDDQADALDTANSWLAKPSRVNDCMAAFGGFPA